MKTVRIAAVVLAILGGIYALLGYATVVRAGGGSDNYVWFLFISVVVIVCGGVAVLSRPDPSGGRAEEGRAAEDREPNTMGKALFWLGVVVLDVLFVLFVLWLFAPSLVLSQKIFSSTGGTLAIVLLDVGIFSVLVGYSRTSSAIRI
jgi:hypothetical protein